MPGPWSATVSSRSASVCSSRTATRPPSGENLTALSSRFHTTCWKRAGSQSSGSRWPSRVTSTAMSRARAAGCTFSIAAAISSAGSNHCRSICSLPDVIRDTSSRSAISWAWTRALRSMALMPETTSGSPPATRCLSSCDQPTMALSGVRSSCDSAARKSSFTRLARSASARAARLAGQEPLPLGLDRVPLGDVGGDGEADARAGMRSRRSSRARRAGRPRAAPAACRATPRWRPAPR